MGDKLQMTLSLKVKGKEDLDVTVEYKNTTLETVRKVQNAVMEALGSINQ
jgi:hypothetical protein